MQEKVGIGRGKLLAWQEEITSSRSRVEYANFQLPASANQQKSMNSSLMKCYLIEGKLRYHSVRCKGLTRPASLYYIEPGTPLHYLSHLNYSRYTDWNRQYVNLSVQRGTYGEIWYLICINCLRLVVPAICGPKNVSVAWCQ